MWSQGTRLVGSARDALYSPVNVYTMATQVFHGTHNTVDQTAPAGLMTSNYSTLISKRMVSRLLDTLCFTITLLYLFCLNQPSRLKLWKVITFVSWMVTRHKTASTTTTLGLCLSYSIVFHVPSLNSHVSIALISQARPIVRRP